jgi:hypothetical protein
VPAELRMRDCHGPSKGPVKDGTLLEQMAAVARPARCTWDPAEKSGSMCRRPTARIAEEQDESPRRPIPPQRPFRLHRIGRSPMASGQATEARLRRCAPPALPPAVPDASIPARARRGRLRQWLRSHDHSLTTATPSSSRGRQIAERRESCRELASGMRTRRKDSAIKETPRDLSAPRPI